MAYTEKELKEMIWKLRSAWLARVIRQSDSGHWVDALDDDERELSGVFNDLMNRVTNPHLYPEKYCDCAQMFTELDGKTGIEVCLACGGQVNPAERE